MTIPQQLLQIDNKRTRPGALFSFADKTRKWLSSPFGVLEMILGIFLLLWGFWILSPWWSSYGSTPSWRVLALISPAWLTGGLPILAALLLLVAQYTRWYKLHHIVLFFLVGYFLFTAIFFYSKFCGNGLDSLLYHCRHLCFSPFRQYEIPSMTLHLRVAELIAASNIFWFGVWIALTPLRSMAYSVRMLYAPEWLWSIPPIVVGLLLAFSVWRGTQLLRIISLLLAMVFFVGITIIFLLTNEQIGAIPLYIHAALLYALLAVVEASSHEQ